MKKCFLTTVILLLFFCSFSQLRFGATGGLTISSTNMADYEANHPSLGTFSISSKSKVGFYIGFLAEKSLGNVFSLRPQLHFIQKGDILNFNSSGSTSTDVLAGNYDDKYSFNYIELPLNIVYNNPGISGRMFIGGGPAIAYAFSGSHKRESETKEKIDFSLYDANKFDLGLNVIGGYEFKNGLFFSLNYNHGFIDIYLDNDTKNRTFGVGIGRYFK